MTCEVALIHNGDDERFEAVVAEAVAAAAESFLLKPLCRRTPLDREWKKICRLQLKEGWKLEL